MLRTHNEDALLVDVDLGLFAVADGLGGHRAGEVASALAVHTVLHVVREGAAAARPDPDRCADLLVEALVHADAAIRLDSATRDERAGMGSTAVIAWVADGRTLVMANVGDSRGYLLRRGRAHQLTQDHTVLEQLRRAGRLSDLAEQQPPRQILSQALGPGDGVAPDVVIETTDPGDQVLLCSDGLTDMLSDADIAEVSAAAGSGPQARCDALVREANRRGGFDNVTVVLVEVGPEP
jgi:protein phosphatase